jgi:hypothetical protein
MNRTTKQDTKIATQLLKAYNSTDFDEDAKKELIKEVRFLIGFNLPKECVDIIKQYLLLPKNKYVIKKRFIDEYIPNNHPFSFLNYLWGHLDFEDDGGTLFTFITNPQFTKEALVKRYMRTLEYDFKKKNSDPYKWYAHLLDCFYKRVNSKNKSLHPFNLDLILENRCNTLICKTYEYKVTKYFKSIIPDLDTALTHSLMRYEWFLENEKDKQLIDKSMEYIKNKLGKVFRKYITDKKYKVTPREEHHPLNHEQYGDLVLRLCDDTFEYVKGAYSNGIGCRCLSNVDFSNFPTYVMTNPSILNYIKSIVIVD